MAVGIVMARKGSTRRQMRPTLRIWEWNVVAEVYTFAVLMCLTHHTAPIDVLV